MLGPQAPGAGRLVTTKREPAPLELKSATLSLGGGARTRVQHQQALPKLLTPRGPPGGPPDAAGSGSDAGRAHGMSSGKSSGGSPPGPDSNPLRVPKAHRQRTTRPSTQHQQAIETRTRQRVSAEAYRAINSVRSQQAANESVGAGFDAAGAGGVGGSAFEAAPLPPWRGPSSKPATEEIEAPGARASTRNRTRTTRTTATAGTAARRSGMNLRNARPAPTTRRPARSCRARPGHTRRRSTTCLVRCARRRSRSARTTSSWSFPTDSPLPLRVIHMEFLTRLIRSCRHASSASLHICSR